MNKPNPDRQTQQRSGDKQRKHRRVSNVPGSTQYRQITETTRAACISDLLEDEWRVAAVRFASGERLSANWLYLVAEKPFRAAVNHGDILTVTRRDPTGFVLLAKLAARR